MFHPKTTLTLPDGSTVQATAPVIVSASRATDIPAFYSEWLMNRIRAGYCIWVNPFSKQPQYVSFENLKVIVFWTKNPAPIIPYLKELDERGVKYYFQYTLNNYEQEGFEPGLPPLQDRIDTFIKLSDIVGPEKIIWRFDPLILTPTLDMNTLGNRIYLTGKQLKNKTNKLVFSFVDISEYSKLSNISESRKMIEFTKETMDGMAERMSKLKGIWHSTEWDIDIATCGEKIDLDKYGISHNKCVDPNLILKLYGDTDIELYNYIKHGKLTKENLDSKTNLTQDKLKDKGQRLSCGCMLSKDIGSYNTCGHFCEYCYANKHADMESTRRNMKNHNPESESII